MLKVSAMIGQNLFKSDIYAFSDVTFLVRVSESERSINLAFLTV